MSNDASSQDIRHLSVLIEQVLHEVRATNESVAVLREELGKVPKRDEFNDLKGEVGAIKTAVQTTNLDLVKLDARVTKLETA